MDKENPFKIPKHDFNSHNITTKKYFSCLKQILKQVHGVAMESLFGPFLVKIIYGALKKDKTGKPNNFKPFYKQIFDSVFDKYFSSKYPNINLSFEKENMIVYFFLF